MQYDVRVSWNHVFSVESVEWKRDFILSTWSPTHTFGDIIQLVNTLGASDLVDNSDNFEKLGAYGGQA